MTAYTIEPVMVDGADVRLGDDVLFLGRAHRLYQIADYDVVIPETETAGWRIGIDKLGWTIALIPGQQYECVR